MQTWRKACRQFGMATALEVYLVSFHSLRRNCPRRLGEFDLVPRRWKYFVLATGGQDRQFEGKRRRTIDRAFAQSGDEGWDCSVRHRHIMLASIDLFGEPNRA